MTNSIHCFRHEEGLGFCSPKGAQLTEEKHEGLLEIQGLDNLSPAEKVAVPKNKVSKKSKTNKKAKKGDKGKKTMNKKASKARSKGKRKGKGRAKAEENQNQAKSLLQNFW